MKPRPGTDMPPAGRDTRGYDAQLIVVRSGFASQFKHDGCALLMTSNRDKEVHRAFCSFQWLVGC